jgi:hypothetical protein
MWNQLWNQFEDKAARLTAGDEIEDAIDETIMWQLAGHPKFVGAPIAANLLQLPELYSGSPWEYLDRWIAFVTINPSIHPDEIFPRRADREMFQIQQLSQFFTERFQPGPLMGPLLHGRNGANQATWRNRNNPTPHGQSTWTRIDRAVSNCLALAGPAPATALGQIATMVDIVPWKFAQWSAVPGGTKAELLALGEPYLTATLQEHTPAVIVAAGESVRRLMHDLHPNTIPPYESGKRQNGIIQVGACAVPWFGVVAPTANRFYVDMQEIAPQMLEYIL